MQYENNRHNESGGGKDAPQNIAGKNEAQAKQKTEPLDRSDNQRIDQEEGRMNNGEIGGDLKKGDES